MFAVPPSCAAALPCTVPMTSTFWPHSCGPCALPVFRPFLFHTKGYGFGRDWFPLAWSPLPLYIGPLYMPRVVPAVWWLYRFIAPPSAGWACRSGSLYTLYITAEVLLHLRRRCAPPPWGEGSGHLDHHPVSVAILLPHRAVDMKEPF